MNTVYACTFLYPHYNLVKGNKPPGDTDAELRLRAAAPERGLGERGVSGGVQNGVHLPLAALSHLYSKASSRSNLLIALQGFSDIMIIHTNLNVHPSLSGCGRSWDVVFHSNPGITWCPGAWHRFGLFTSTKGSQCTNTAEINCCASWHRGQGWGFRTI